MRLFVTSDVHSFFTPFKKALAEKGFEPNNQNHLLLVLGDIFDRGGESWEIYNYLNNLTNVVLIRGNHEDLLEEMLQRGYGEKHDISNGTVWTACQLADGVGAKTKSTYEVCKVVEDLIKPFFNKFVNYYESANYIFVHSFIPCTVHYHGVGDSRPWYLSSKTYEYMSDWREASEVEWEEARWGNPFKLAEAGLNQTGKTLVHGHWGTYEARPKDYEGDDLFRPFYGHNCIGLDATTALSGEVNVVVLEDDLIERTEKEI
jgi:serine/threonine protein phosphatase 1